MKSSYSVCDLLNISDPVHASLTVTDIALDSRQVSAGSLFIAIAGARQDGAAYIDQAVAQGARVIVGERSRPDHLPPDIAYFQVESSRTAAAQIASRFFPRQPQTVVAVTGTSGKSSVVEFYRQLMDGLGEEAACLGTLGVATGKGVDYGSLTTPDSIALHKILQSLSDEGIKFLAMEASSHGIEQSRLDGVRLKAAAFTNIGRDHLDYHKTEEAYIQAKLRLFTTLLPADGSAVINLDGAHSGSFIDAARERKLNIITTGFKGQTLCLNKLDIDGFSQVLTVTSKEGCHQARLPLAGAFQAENLLVACGLVMASRPETGFSALVPLIENLKGVKGRLERVGEINGALCIVDYAHKPDGLSQVLDTLRPFVKGRLICVFGCGGDRDKGKRPLMGRIAAQKADKVIVTDDNPRSEDPSEIRKEILAGAPEAQEIGNRHEAIDFAVRQLLPGDILIVAGKGHETGQIVKDQIIPFSDEDEIKKAIMEIRP